MISGRVEVTVIDDIVYMTVNVIVHPARLDGMKIAIVIKCVSLGIGHSDIAGLLLIRGLVYCFRLGHIHGPWIVY